ncbi:hypothetical protein ON010_g835 [Phytophthora cinnamomi]|nr:hypothetical protein ON010_g835 [Phytophthora cinnamomi]
MLRLWAHRAVRHRLWGPQPSGGRGNGLGEPCGGVEGDGTDAESGGVSTPLSTTTDARMRKRSLLAAAAVSTAIANGVRRTNATWFPVKWRCTACGSSTNDASGGGIDSEAIEALCPGNVDRANASLVVGDDISSSQRATNETIGDTTGSNGDASFDGIVYPGSFDNDTSGGSDAQIDEPNVDPSSSSGIDNTGISAGGSSSDIDNTGISPSSRNEVIAINDNTSISNDGSGFSSSSRSSNTDPWNEHKGKTAAPVPSTASVSTSPPAAWSSNSGAPSSPTLVPVSTNSPAITPSTGTTYVPSTPTLPGPATLTPEPSSSRRDNDASSVAASAENSQDRGATRTSSATSSPSTTAPVTGNKNHQPASTAAPPSQTSGSRDQSSNGGSLSATSTVTNSPFFYAAIVLAIVGFIGVVVGFRAKRVRSPQNEMRNYRTSARQSARAATPASNASPSTDFADRVQFDDHNIVVLPRLSNGALFFHRFVDRGPVERSPAWSPRLDLLNAYTHPPRT